MLKTEIEKAEINQGSTRASRVVAGAPHATCWQTFQLESVWVQPGFRRVRREARRTAPGAGALPNHIKQSAPFVKFASKKLLQIPFPFLRFFSRIIPQHGN